MDLQRHAKIYRALRHPIPVQIGGSLALILYGYDLGRIPHDLDIVVPVDYDDFINNTISRILHTIDDNVAEHGPSMDEFDLGFKVETQGSNIHGASEYMHIDIRFDMDAVSNYKDIVYKEQTYRLNSLEAIISAKMRYALQRGNRSAEKHARDLRELHKQGAPGIKVEALPISFTNERPTRGSWRSSRSSYGSYRPF
jgi:hypothetical protein